MVVHIEEGVDLIFRVEFNFLKVIIHIIVLVKIKEILL